ncbi:MAG: cellulase family glycosylhydrolase [Oscillospiraceae bacterium]|jgi:hypothetical protein|nr:cellulase family glycosylhydrolase [Oscillospiraceae bacterium]
MRTYGYKKIIAAACALIIAGASFGSDSVINTVINNKANLAVSAAVDDWNDDWLHCEGDEIKDMYGNKVRLTGVNWFGFNCTENVIHYSWLGVDVKVQLQSIVDHGYNLLRVPVSTELLYSWMIGDPLASSGVTAYNGGGTVVNPELIDPETGQGSKNSLFLFEQLMAMCKEMGIKVMVDVHSTQSHNSGHNFELWYGFAGNSETISGEKIGMMGTDEWIDSLVWLADKYSNDDTLVAYDLKNEPHGKGDDCAAGKGAKWDGSTDEWNWKYAAETCGNAILEVNPNALIVVEGIEVYAKIGNQVADGNGTPWTGDPWKAPAGFGHAETSVSNYYGAWWGGNLRGVRDYPISCVSPETGYSQLVYSPHDYGPSVYAQTWFDKDFTEQTLLEDYWYDTWAYIDTENIAPLLIGEWGGHMDGGKNQKWMELLRDYMTKEEINATFWCYNTNSGDTGGLLAGGSGGTVDWDEEKHGMVELSLWQDDSGNYIGLDHQVPLGANGVSLNDHYNITGGGGGGTTTKPPTTTTKSPTTTTTKSPTTTTTKITTVGGDVVCGDIDGDGTAGKMNDIVLFAKYFKGNIKLNAKAIANAQCDTNGDSATKIDSSDLTALISYLLGEVKQLPL